ncbi:MAG: AAA family ATPase, partial [Nitrospinota bacterium]
MRRPNGDYLRHFPAVAAQIVGRTHEIETIMATLAAGKHIILEGPPGTSKSTILKAITQAVGLPFYYLAGSVDLTPSKFVGHFNPANIMQDTYHPDHFTEGPLLHAMRGGVLFIEEFNRVPADTANVLITAVEEGEITVPRYGTVRADPDFRVVCAHNPLDDIGTVRISRALYDRFCCLRMEHQSLEEELEVVNRVVGTEDEMINRVAVHLIRATRRVKEIRQGASIRAAMDMVTVFHALGRLDELSYFDRMAEAMRTGVSSKIWLSELCTRTPEEVLEDLLNDVLRILHLEDLAEDVDFVPAQREQGEGGDEEAVEVEGEVDDGRPESDPSSSGPERRRPMETRPLVEELKKRVVQAPDEVAQFLNQHPDMASRILASPDVLEMYSYIRRKVDAELREAAKRYASRLILKIAKEIANLGVQSGNLEAVPDYLASDEIEIDKTLERIVEQPNESIEENLVVLARKPEEREGCVVMLDHSSSMKGIKVAIAALTAATIALHYKENYAVVGFNTRASVLKRITQGIPPSRVAEEVLSLDARGLTNIREALQLAIAEMRNYEKRIGILLTDGDWTFGGDPMPVARLFDRLHVIGLEEPTTTYELEYTGTTVQTGYERYHNLPRYYRRVES